MALRYVGRYQTTRAKLKAYLKRKLTERGWAGTSDPDIASLIERLAAQGYVDDRLFAATRATSLARRGYGARRLDAALFIAGVAPEDGEEARRHAADAEWDAATSFARRRRIGPFAGARADLAGSKKALAAMIRAGHPFEIARKFVDCEPGAVPEKDA